ncbi:hypothetical protein [Streptomyces sp. NPDC051567]|uniref:hypothetical protein n=1 Tax=Streptomyces sp. NPDC051567 TaxID=3365660 RepID=UPI0037B682AC
MLMVLVVKAPVRSGPSVPGRSVLALAPVLVPVLGLPVVKVPVVGLVLPGLGRVVSRVRLVGSAGSVGPVRVTGDG